MSKYKEMLTPKSIEAADASHGRVIYDKTCGTCHKLFGEGAQIGPDLTSVKRWSVDFLLTNSIAPSQEIPAAYQTELVVTFDGKTLSGVVTKEDDEKIVLMTADKPRVEILKDDIDARKASKLSLMPAGQLDELQPDDVRDLMKYLQSLHQVE